MDGVPVSSVRYGGPPLSPCTLAAGTWVVLGTTSRGKRGWRNSGAQLIMGEPQ